MNNVMEAVCTVCSHVRARTKTGTTFQNLLKELRREFKKNEFDIKIRSHSKKFLSAEEFYVNAYYDAEDDRLKETAIEVVIYHNFTTDVVWDSKQTTGLLIQIFDAVVHEFKHQRQSRKRKYKCYWEHHDAGQYFQEYLQDPDEVDAYALSIAIELCRLLGKHRALRNLPRFTKLARLKVNEQFVSPNLNAYVAHFDADHSPILRKLSKKIYVRLMKVDTDFIFM